MCADRRCSILLLQVANLKEQLGPQHQKTAHAISALAFLSKAHGRSKTAVELYAEALHSRMRIHGEKHPQTLTCMSNLAIATYALLSVALSHRIVLSPALPDPLSW